MRAMSVINACQVQLRPLACVGHGLSGLVNSGGRQGFDMYVAARPAKSAWPRKLSSMAVEAAATASAASISIVHLYYAGPETMYAP